jgi:hypothetical protein
MNPDQPAWTPQPDGSRSRTTNGIKITVHAGRAHPRIEHLVTWQEDGSTHILGLDVACRPVYVTALTCG